MWFPGRKVGWLPVLAGLYLIVPAVWMLCNGRYVTWGSRGVSGHSVPASEGIPMCLSASFIGLVLIGTGIWWMRMDDGE